MTIPEVACCSDEHYCQVVYELSLYIADYPEQTLATGVVQGWCLKCIKHQKELEDPASDLCRCRKHMKELKGHLNPQVL